jgi:hypothetical protein
MFMNDCAFRRTNELKADVDIPAETGDEFECFWEDHAPLQGT